MPSALAPVTTFSTASRARLRRAIRSGPPGRIGRSERVVIGGEDVTGRLECHQGRAGERGATRRPWGGGLPRPDGRKPYGRGAARRSAGPHPPAGGQGRNAVPMTAPAQSDRGRPPRRTSSRRAKIIVKGAPKGASLRDGASATPDTDLPQQDPGTYREDGGGVVVGIALRLSAVNQFLTAFRLAHQLSWAHRAGLNLAIQGRSTLTNTARR